MPGCPACGTEVTPPALECPRCHLSVALFEAVREAVGVAESDPSFSTEVHELLRAVDSDGPAEPEAPVAEPTGAAVLSYPSRFPATEAPRPASREPDPPAPPSLDGLPALPALPSGGVAGLRRQIDDYQKLGRSMGIDLGDAVERNREAIAVDDRPTLERLSRELFVRIAAAVAEEYEATIVRRNGVATLMNTAAEDAELRTIRSQLLAGDLAGSHLQLSQIRERLVAIEEDHATLMILVAECDLLAHTIRELGGDPGPALGPVDEGRRLMMEGDRAHAGQVLAHASVALWAVLYPRLGPELRRLKDAMIAQKAAGTDVEAEVQLLRDVATNLKHRNFAATIASYRKLRTLVGAAPEATPSGSTSPTSPSPSPAPH